MAFKRVQAASNVDVKFFDEWEKSLSEPDKKLLTGVLISPTFIKPVQSGKGYILSFNEEFIIFVWKNSSAGKAIKELVTNECGNLPLIEFAVSGFKLAFSLGCDDDYEVTLDADQDNDKDFSVIITTNAPPISPEQDRKSIFDLPKLSYKSTPATIDKKAKAK